MFAWCSKCVISTSSPAPSMGLRIALRDQIDRLGGAAHEDDFVARARVDEALHAIARALVHRRGFLAQGMHAAMDVGMVMAFVIVHRIDDALGALRRGAIVQIGQGLAVDHARQDREMPPRGLDVEASGPSRPGRYFSSEFPQYLRVG